MSETTQTRELYYYGGNGWGGVPKHGLFQIVAGSKKTMHTDRDAARVIYNGINDDKAFWDVTKISELIESHTLTPLSDSDELPF
jgi:hypothetical protein